MSRSPDDDTPNREGADQAGTPAPSDCHEPNVEAPAQDTMGEEALDIMTPTTHEGAISAERFGKLADAIEHDVIPRLLMAYRQREAGQNAPTTADWHADKNMPDQLADILLDDQPDLALKFLHDLQALGARPPALMLEILAPCAARLGQKWDEDSADFTQVTLAMGHLTYLLRCVVQQDGRDGAIGLDDRRSILATPPDEQHHFGLQVVTEFLRIAGWHVTSRPCLSRRMLIDAVKKDRFALVGFSVSSERSADWLKASIAAIRRSSLNADVQIMVGGKCFLDRPSLVSLVGADFMARDGREAVGKAETMIARTHKSGT